MKDFIAFLEEKKVPVIVGYLAFMLAFYFIGIPKQSFFGFLLSFFVTTVFYVLVVFFIKKIWFDKK